MRHCTLHQGLISCLKLKHLLLYALLLLFLTPLFAQTIDEQTPMTSTWTGVGADSADYAAQSFVANVSRVRKIGVWLQRDSANSEVRLALMKDDGFNQPDLNFVLHESALLSPAAGGGWVYDSTFSQVLVPGEKYWLVIDGYNNFTATGYVRIGTSNVFTDTGDPLRYSSDAGQNWASLPGIPMAVFVEGDNCSFTLTPTPASAIVCPDSSVTLSVPSGFVSYAWSTGETSSSIQALVAGAYTVTVVDGNNCTAIAGVGVQQGVVPVSQFQDKYSFCEGETLALGVPPFYAAYLWSDGTTTPQDTFSVSGEYWIRITSSAGCVGIDTFEIEVYPKPPLPIWPDTTACAGDELIFDAGPGYTTYVWSTGNLTQAVAVTSLTYLWVQVTDTNNCVNRTDTSEINFSPLPGRPTIQVFPTYLNSSFANGYQWFQDGQLIPGATNQALQNPAVGEYSVIIYNAFGCSAQSNNVSVLPEAPGDFVAGGLSPNGDGVNDVFYVEGLWRYPANKLSIFNRWGEQVYQASPYNNDWAGLSSSGSALPDGNYFIVLDFGGDRETYKGTVMISR